MLRAKLKVVADIDLPFVREYFGKEELILRPGRSLKRADVLDADLLLVRSITTVDEKLLQGTPVKFVGTVTTGIDHLDTAWLDQSGILWRSAAGYNAQPVAEYVIASIAALQELGQLPLDDLRIGLVGVGQVGSRVAEHCASLGFKLLLCDPPRAKQEAHFAHQDLSCLDNVDLVSLHTPLSKTGPDATQHLIDGPFLRAAKNKTVLLNTSRGAVVDFAALSEGEAQWTYCFDVWEGEPQIDLQRLRSTLIATPHLAGYSVQCRSRGIEMIHQACCELGLMAANKSASPPLPAQVLSFGGRRLNWREVVLSIFNPLSITRVLKETLLKGPEKCATLFDELRQHYIGDAIRRHEFNRTTVSELSLKEEDRYALTKLGITIEE